MQRFCWVFLDFWVFRDPPYGAIQSYPAGNSLISSTLTQSKASSRSHSCAAMCSPQKINFCMIFSAFLQFCSDSQLIFWKINYISKLYQKIQLLFLWPKFQKHGQHSKNRVFVMGYEVLKLTFRALFMLEIPVSLLHIVHNTLKSTIKAENQKTCRGPNVRSGTSVGQFGNAG